MYQVFERLNTGGTHLNPQEVRNSAAHGPFNDLMLELNEFDEWREIFGRGAPDPRMRDVELVVRFCALRDASVAYSKPMKVFLNNYMKRHQYEKSKEATKGIFETTVKRVLGSLGQRPFHITRGINVAAFDSAMLAFSGAQQIPTDITSRWEKLLRNTSYIDSIKSATTDEKTVERRIRIASETLFK